MTEPDFTLLKGGHDSAVEPGQDSRSPADTVACNPYRPVEAQEQTRVTESHIQELSCRGCIDTSDSVAITARVSNATRLTTWLTFWSMLAVYFSGGIGTVQTAINNRAAAHFKSFLFGTWISFGGAQTFHSGKQSISRQFKDHFVCR
jgi:hypothetical protein